MSEAIAGVRQRVISPVDGSVYAEFDLPSGAEIEATLERAVRAQDAWKRVPLAERSAICRRMTDLMVERADAIGTELTWQIGRPVKQSPFEIRRGFQERARYMVDVAGDALADDVLEPKDGFRRFIRREPLGVVLVMAPWNYPYLASVNTVIPAIVAGNGVILKVSQQTPRVAEHYAKAFADAGLPEGVFQYLHASHDDLARLIADPRIRFVSFTGSVAGGAAVQRAASGQFIATNLELGGKDPAYVRPDAPLEATIDNLVDGAYFNAGQSCCAVERIYVHQDIYRPFVDGFIDLTRKYRLGNPLESRDHAGADGPGQRGSVRPRSNRRGRPAGRARGDRSARVRGRSRRHAVRGAAGAARRRSRHARHDRGDVRAGRGGDGGQG